VVIVPASGLFSVHRAPIAALAVAARLPTVATDRRYITPEVQGCGAATMLVRRTPIPTTARGMS